jgi:hypothetical protein
MFRKAKQNLDVDDDWTLAQTMFGVTTYYRREDDGSLSIKMEGRLEGTPLFDQVAVLREVDLHYKWAPFCSSSLTIAHLNKLDTVGWFVVGIPNFGLMRDACFRAMGCDSIIEDGTILLVGQGIADRPQDGVREASLQKTNANGTRYSENGNVDGFTFLRDDPVLQELDLPNVPTGIGSGRMTIRTFQAIIHVESPMEATTRIVANVDPNLPLIPQSLIDFLMKKLCGVLLAKLQNAAKKVSKDPIYNDHAQIMRREEAFYKGWLMEKFRSTCELRGWTMPAVSSFQLTDQQLELAEDAYQKKRKKKDKESVKLIMREEKLDHYLERKNIDTNSEANMRNPRLIPRLSTPDRDADSISEISVFSTFTNSSLWSRNPVVKYLRDLESTTQQRKQREIEMSREKAANRLKPRELDKMSKSRLQELRAAREKQNDGISDKTTTPQQSLTERSHRKDWVTMWTNHSTFTRLVLITMLVVTLSSLLHMDTLIEDQLAQYITRNWAISRSRDIAAIVYLLVTSTLHFGLCYVALMYSFSSLQLGMIAGREAKIFYSKNVHLIIYVSSGTMMLASIVIAGWRCFSSWLLRTSICSEGLLRVTLGIPLKLMDYFFNSVEKPDGYCESLLAIKSWREDAYAIIRVLFMYSATFLLTLLMLFNLSAKKAVRTSVGRSESDISDSEKNMSTSTRSALGSNKSSRLSSNSTLQDERIRANTYTFDTIQEGSETELRSLPVGKAKKNLFARLRKRR